MGGGGNYCLRLDDFGSNILTTWQQLQIDKNFCDVTLACEDGQIMSHRIIVSHSSPVLKNILKQSSSQHPVIYLRGVKYKLLEYLFIFMHQGEVTVAEDDLGNFLDVAEDLKITGLSPENRESIIPSEEITKSIDDVLGYNLNKDLDEYQMPQNSRESLSKRKRNIQKCTKVNSDSMKTSVSLNYEGNNRVSDLSNEKGRSQKLESVSDKQFSCNICDKQYNRADYLGRHKASAHDGVRYPCDQCDATPFNRADLLKRHKASAHKGIRYPCDQCNASTYTDPSSLRRHKASAHVITKQL